MEPKAIFFMNLHLKAGFGVEFRVYEGKMMKKVALTSFTLYDAYSSFSTIIDVTN